MSLLKTIDKTKIEPVVCCLNWKGAWAHEIEEKSIKIIALNKRGKFDINAFFKLVKIIKKGKFDIVNTHLWAADSIGRLAAIIAGAPIIVSTAQNVDIWKKWWHRLIDKLLSYKTNMIIAVSDAVKEYYHKKVGIPESKIVVIPNAIEIERFENAGDTNYLYTELDLTKNDFILSCVGRLTEQKGQKYLLESLKTLNGKYSNLKVLFIGEGEDKQKLVDIAKKNKLDKMVRFIGQRKDIPQILDLSNGVILPSLYEGLPVCILEAMAAEKPIIATDVGGTNKLIKNKETGLLIPPCDINVLSSAIKELIDLGDNANTLGKKAKEKVKQEFSIIIIAKKTTDLFYKLGKK